MKNIYLKSLSRGFRTLLFSFIAVIFINENVFAQTPKMSITKSNITVRDLLDQIEKSTNYTFAYADGVFNEDREVSVLASNKNIDDIILSAIPNVDVQFEGTSILILPKSNKASTSQQKERVTITGVVTDNDNQPLIGAMVTIDGTTKGIITMDGGKYSISAAIGETLVFSYTGLETKSITVSTQSTINVSLETSALEVDEVVVVGYGVQKKANLSGAVASIPTETLEDRPVLSVGQALQGAVANLNITMSSGEISDTPSFNIRGYESINGGEPLIVIDGIISDVNTLNRMNPSDIASSSVLKDASSSAIYGSRAAFGVILITTKKGQGEKITVNYNSNYVFRTRTKVPEVITDPYLVAETRNTMSYPWYNLYNTDQLDYAKQVSEGTADPYYLNSDGTYTYFGETDWVNEAYDKFGFSTTQNLSVSGASDKMNYYFSTAYDYQGNMIKYGEDTYKRYNIRSNLDFKITDWWTVSNNTSFIKSNYYTPEAMEWDYYWSLNRTNSMDVPYNPDGSWTSKGASLFGIMESGGTWVREEENFTTHFSTKIDVIKDQLTLNGNFAYTSNGSGQEYNQLPVAYTYGPDQPIYYYNEITSATSTSSESSNTSFDFYGNYRKNFGKHSINVIAGYNQEEYRYDYTYMRRYELITSSLPTLDLATGEKSLSQSIDTWAVRGTYGRFNYIYDEKYIAEFNGRYDGTSRFQPDSRYVFSPSGSVAWLVSKENFFKPLENIFSFFKLRYSYGTLGNQDVDSYAYLATMGSGTMSQILDGEQSLYVSAPGLVSGSLTWEKVTTSNIGLDLGFFKNKLNVTAEYYIRNTTDMLTSGVKLPNVLGADEPEENAADLQTKGWELTLSWRDKFNLGGKPLSYSVNFNLADSRSFITKYANSTGSLSDYYVGREIGEIWGLTTEGLFQSQAEIDNHADQTLVTSYPGTRPLEAGDIKFKDLDGDGSINDGDWTVDDSGDYTIIGNTSARYTFGLSADLQWNGFDLTVFLQGVGKKDYYPGSSDLYFWGTYSQPWTNTTEYNYYDRWTEDNPNGYFPRQKSYVAEYTEAVETQTRYLQSAAYIRLKNITIGYTLPQHLSQKLGVEKLRVFFSGDNLAYLSGLYKNYVDPETLNSMSYPMQRYFSTGLNITF